MERDVNWEIEREITIDVGVRSRLHSCRLFAYITLGMLTTQLIFGP